MFKRPFSFQGRIRSLEYGISLILYNITLALIGAMESESREEIVLINLALIALGTWFALAQGSKRCHDLGHSGWWQAIPLYVVWMLFAAGRPGSNKYGENPKGLYNGNGAYDGDVAHLPTIE